MSAPTPAEVAARHTRPERFFDPRRPAQGEAESGAQARARCRDVALGGADYLAGALKALRGHEGDLDLNVERYHRAVDHLLHSLKAFDDALADGPAVPAPQRRRHGP